jgi:hypothetical protein
MPKIWNADTAIDLMERKGNKIMESVVMVVFRSRNLRQMK